jgi:hypothetical protein
MDVSYSGFHYKCECPLKKPLLLVCLSLFLAYYRGLFGNNELGFGIGVTWMLNRRDYLLCAIILCMGFSRVAEATSSCEQTLKLLGVTGARFVGDCVFWVAEDLSGECHESRLIQLAVQKGQARLIKSPLKSFQGWGGLSEAVALLEGPKVVPLKKQGVYWQDNDGWIKLAVPTPNQPLHERYLEAAQSWCSSAREWNTRMGHQGIICPSVDGMRVELLHAYASGYYVNYCVKKAFYYPGRSLLFVQTEQTQKAVGMDTMHGFLVFRLWPETKASVE